MDFWLFLIPKLMKMINMPVELLGMGRQYLLISIGFSFVNATLNIFTVVFRGLGRMLSVTFTLITVNVIAFLLNLSIYTFIPIEHQSLLLYACTGIVGQLIGISIYIFMLVRSKEFPFRFSIKEGISNSRSIVYQILRFGIPGGYLKWGLTGIWIGYVADIAFRSIMGFHRWNSGKWMKHYSGGFVDG